MSLIDFILNLAALLLWVNWRGVSLDPLAKATPATLIGTLRRAEPTMLKSWHFPVALIALLFFRAVLYRQLGPALDWAGQLDLVATSLSFQSDFFQRMLLFSVLSFAWMLIVFYFWLLLISLLGAGGGDFFLPRLARAQLRRVDGWPIGVRVLLPLLVGAGLWWLLSWPLVAWGFLPRPVAEPNRLAQAALVGLGAYMSWKYLLAGLLTLHLVNKYVYFGRHPFWPYVNAVAGRLLAPLASIPLRAGKVDLAPVVAVVLIFLVARVAEAGLNVFGLFRIPGLPELYQHTLR